MTTLRQRMIDAMVLRGFRPRTQESYLRAVSQMARHYHRSPELITDQEVRAYLLHLVRVGNWPAPASTKPPAPCASWCARCWARPSGVRAFPWL
jgi:hypothetical protein